METNLVSFSQDVKDSEFETPILLLLFNRIEYTKVIFSKIKEIRPAYLFVAADGPRLSVDNEASICEEVRNYVINNIDWHCKVTTLFRSENLGSGKAVSEAISWFFTLVEYGIILEDDCIPTFSFFKYCETMLIKYKDNEAIGMVCGSNYLFNKFNLDNYFFSKFCFIWGWATWKRVWDKYSLNIENYNSQFFSKVLDNRFNDKLIERYHLQLMEHAQQKRVDAWDIQFTYLFYINNYLSIIPLKNQITNIGFIGTHTASVKKRPKISSMGAPSLELNIKNFKSFSASDLLPNEKYDKWIKKYLKIILKDDMRIEPWWKNIINKVLYQKSVTSIKRLLIRNIKLVTLLMK